MLMMIRSFGIINTILQPMDINASMIVMLQRNVANSEPPNLSGHSKELV